MPSQQPTPRLAPPGAGIPAIERLVGGLILKTKRLRYDRDHVSARFSHERALIASLYQSRAQDQLLTRVLVPRLRGLEDSSRFWSILMTLDHLRIVNTQITSVIDSLTRGVVPARKASTAAVKPDPAVGLDVIPLYEESCEALLAKTASLTTLRTPTRFAHPWFGPLDAAGWHVMSATHLAIHRHQIAAILNLTATVPA